MSETTKTPLLILLANEMDQNGNLNFESRARADLAAKLYYKSNKSRIITCGWDYRPDSDVPIASALTKYLVSECGINPSQIHDECRSRDTVGDAVFTRDYLRHQSNPQHLWVITSDYHVERTKLIFDFVFAGVSSVEVFGSKTTEIEKTITSEAHSIEAFQRTFAGVSPGDFHMILDTLLSKHPFYNGTNHPQFYYDQ